MWLLNCSYITELKTFNWGVRKKGTIVDHLNFPFIDFYRINRHNKTWYENVCQSVVYYNLDNSRVSTYVPFSGLTVFEVVNERVTFTEAFHICQLAQPNFHFDNTTFTLTPDDSLNLQRDTNYWLGYVFTQTAYLYLGESYQDKLTLLRDWQYFKNCIEQ